MEEVFEVPGPGTGRGGGPGLRFGSRSQARHSNHLESINFGTDSRSWRHRFIRL